MSSETCKLAYYVRGLLKLVVLGQEGDLLDGSSILGASKGSIVGGGIGGAGIGTILQDLREAYLQDFGGSEGLKLRDKRAKEFDQRLEILAARSLQEDSAMDS